MVDSSEVARAKRRTVERRVPSPDSRVAEGPPGSSALLAGLRRALHRYVPAHFHDPFGLTVRLVRSRDPAALYALGLAAGALAVTPLDLALQPAERRLYADAGPPRRPHLIVVGPPRSGTTLVALTLIQNLPVACLNNLAALFPRSPLVANRMLGRWLRPPPPTTHSFYGKTVGLLGHHDVLHLWDRWLGKDRTRIPEHLPEARRDEMRRFFGACEGLFERSLVLKNNNLASYASRVAEALPTVRFLFLTRDPLYLAQSLLDARRLIHGSDDVPYGLHEVVVRPSDRSVTDDVCRQVRFLRERMDEERKTLGPLASTLSYEAFCADPAGVVCDVARRTLDVDADAAALRARLRPLTPSRRVRIPAAEFEALATGLRALGEL
jgi:hypothetical protein